MVRSDQVAAEKKPLQAQEPEPRVPERRAWFPPEIQDFETAMEVTAYVLRR
jgi:coenzyme PQQ precursor peptide PqqA